eukprot:gene3431-6070_t
MTASWRAAGLSYIQFSNIAARMVRSALKPEAANAAAKRAGGNINVRLYEHGKLQSQKPFTSQIKA